MGTNSTNTGNISGSTSEQNEKSSQPVSIKTINDADSTSQMHFNGKSTFYSLNEYEFKTIKNGVDNYWKELTIASWSIFVPLVLNTIAEGNQSKWETSLSNITLFLNCSFTLITFILAVVFSIAWHYSKNELKEVISEVEKKPKFKI